MFNERNDATKGVGPQRPGGSRRRGPGHHHSMPGGPFRGGPFRRDSRRQRRGDVRAAVLVLLEEQPRNGYQIIQELTERSNEAWRPSPGSIYPILQQLEDEGLVTVSAAGSGRTYELTAAGRDLVAEQREQLGKPWESADLGFSTSVRELMGTARDVMMAAKQVILAGSETQIARATSIMVETRRSLYGLLAEGDES
jgi:DNA-binding PadR family transcriptional regulator